VESAVAEVSRADGVAEDCGASSEPSDHPL